ncbi:hypothetical protein STRTUCAR8_04499, partial [Streptomyces turgidiscabies Car8]
MDFLHAPRLRDPTDTPGRTRGTDTGRQAA